MTASELTTTETATTAVSVADMFPATAGERAEYTQQAELVTRALSEVDPASPEFESALDQIREIGREEVSKSSEALDELLGRRIIPEEGDSPAISGAGAQLDDLRDAVVDLDPSGTPRTFRGKLSRSVSKMPGGKKLRKMISGYESAGTQIKHIADALKASRETLAKDGDLARVEMQRLWDDLDTLGRQDAKFTALSERLGNRSQELRRAGDDRAADALESQALTAVNLRRQDVATHAGVVMNAYMTLKVLTDTGKKLSDNIYYAENTSLTALRLVAASGVVAGAQGAAAKQVDAVRDVTGDLMVKGAQQLARQTKHINEQATKTAVGVDKIRESFQITYGAIEDATKAGMEANAKIQKQIEELNHGLADFRGKGFERKAVTRK